MASFMPNVQSSNPENIFRLYFIPPSQKRRRYRSFSFRHKMRLLTTAAAANNNTSDDAGEKEVGSQSYPNILITLSYFLKTLFCICMFILF